MPPSASLQALPVLPLRPAAAYAGPRSGSKRNGPDIHALVTAVAPIAEIWHWAMMWSAFLFSPVLAGPPPDGGGAGGFRARRVFRRDHCCLLRRGAFQPAAAAALSRNRGLHPGRLSSTLPVAYPAPPEENMTALQTDEKTVAQPHAVVIGGGPAELMAAEVMAKAGIRVEIFDAMPSVGRKFLLAGLGGLNLTHSGRWSVSSPAMPNARRTWHPGWNGFPPTTCVPGRRVGDRDLRRQQRPGLSSPDEGIAAATRVASPSRRSGRHAPRATAGSASTRSGMPLGTTGGDVISVTADATVLALGGASWPKLGSDGSWAGILQERGIIVRPLRPANAGSPWHGTRASSRNTRASRSRTSLSASVERPFAGS